MDKCTEMRGGSHVIFWCLEPWKWKMKCIIHVIRSFSVSSEMSGNLRLRLWMAAVIMVKWWNPYRIYTSAGKSAVMDDDIFVALAFQKVRQCRPIVKILPGPRLHSQCRRWWCSYSRRWSERRSWTGEEPRCSLRARSGSAGRALWRHPVDGIGKNSLLSGNANGKTKCLLQHMFLINRRFLSTK